MHEFATRSERRLILETEKIARKKGNIVKIVLIVTNFILPYLGNYLNDRTKLASLAMVIILTLPSYYVEEDVVFGYLYIKWSVVCLIALIICVFFHSIYTLGEVRVQFRNCWVGLFFAVLFAVSVFFLELPGNAFVLASRTLEPYESGAVLIADGDSPVVGDAVVARDTVDNGRTHFGILGGLPGWTLKRDPDGSFDSCNGAGECVSTDSMCITTLDDVETYRLGPNEAVIFKIRRVGSIAAHVEKVEDIKQVSRYFDAKTFIEFAKSVENGCSWTKED